jgi:hypothetical protein
MMGFFSVFVFALLSDEETREGINEHPLNELFD